MTPELAALRSLCLPAEPTEVFVTYWRFAAERQRVFYRRLEGRPAPWTDDPILVGYRFTNAYRASDRVSQYLIRHVQYTGDLAPEDLFYRTVLFKLFNRIETWERLEGALGPVLWQTWDFAQLDRVLAGAMAAGDRIYSAAYIMPSGCSAFGHSSKHRNHLALMEWMMREELPRRICEARRMRDVFELLRGCPTLGDFLAYQLTIDLNYSLLTGFDEMEFVVPGPGARDGIRKCFRDIGGLTEADLVRWVADRQAEMCRAAGVDFRTLWGRSLQLVDCQNLFCEVDKYARVAHPEVSGRSGRQRIKQRYRLRAPYPTCWYPPKWGINEAIAETEGR